MGDRCGMSISADSPSDETLNRGPLALLLQREYEFPFGINIVQFSFSFSSNLFHSLLWIDFMVDFMGCLESVQQTQTRTKII